MWSRFVGCDVVIRHQKELVQRRRAGAVLSNHKSGPPNIRIQTKDLRQIWKGSKTVQCPCWIDESISQHSAPSHCHVRPEAFVFSAIDFDSKNCGMNAFFFLRQHGPRSLRWTKMNKYWSWRFLTVFFLCRRSQGPASSWLLALLDPFWVVNAQALGWFQFFSKTWELRLDMKHFDQTLHSEFPWFQTDLNIASQDWIYKRPFVHAKAPGVQRPICFSYRWDSGTGLSRKSRSRQGFQPRISWPSLCF